MEKLQREPVRAALDHRHDRLVAEGGIGVVDHRLQLVIGDLAIDERLDDRKGDFLIGLAAQRADTVGRQERPFARQIEPAILRKAG